jgi:hypothetical protein
VAGQLRFRFPGPEPERAHHMRAGPEWAAAGRVTGPDVTTRILVVRQAGPGGPVRHGLRARSRRGHGAVTARSRRGHGVVTAWSRLDPTERETGR